MTPPKGVSIDDTMRVDIKLLEIYSKEDVRVVGANENIYKTIKQRSESWESPREPYAVSCHIHTKEKKREVDAFQRS